MKRIYKYSVGIVSRQAIIMPKNAAILSIQFQDGSLCMWALVNPEAPNESRTFAVIGTGHDFPHDVDWTYLATVQDGSYIWHIFEVKE